MWLLPLWGLSVLNWQRYTSLADCFNARRRRAKRLELAESQSHLQSVNSPGWWWWPSRLLSPSAHCFQAQQWSRIKLVPSKHSRHKTNNFNIDEWQQGWIIVHERRQACFSERGNPPYSTASAAAESQRTLKAGPTSSSSSVLLTRQQDTAASRYRPRSGAGSSLLFWPASTERHFPQRPKMAHAHQKQTHTHAWVSGDNVKTGLNITHGGFLRRHRRLPFLFCSILFHCHKYMTASIHFDI